MHVASCRVTKIAKNLNESAHNITAWLNNQHKETRQITHFPMPLGIRLGVDLGGVKSKTEDLVLLRRELAGLTNSIESRQCTCK